MNANKIRRIAAARVLRDRVRTNRAASRLSRKGSGTLATYVMATGLGIADARSMASTLRKNAAKLEIPGQRSVSHVKGRTVESTRYTRSEVVAIVTQYRPRKAEFKAARATLLAI